MFLSQSKRGMCVLVDGVCAHSVVAWCSCHRARGGCVSYWTVCAHVVWCGCGDLPPFPPSHSIFTWLCHVRAIH